MLQCVARRGDRGELVAYFGYVNDNPAAVPIPQGPDNEVLPSDHETGQPSSFSPGRVTNAFAVTLTDEEVVWTLRGPDGQTRSAAASARSRPCAAHSGLAEGRFALLMPLLAAATAALWWARSRRRYRSHVR
ncbi:MAG: hypothetical protein ACRDYX_12550 [Egibacteraceae bacterium]